MVLAGLILAVIRRAVIMKAHINTAGVDKFAIAVLALIVCSGFVLQAIKTTSRGEYLAMVADYGDDSDPQEAKALEAYWVDQYGLVSGAVKPPFTDQLLVQGEELHEQSCMECHTKPQTAFVSYTVSRVIKPLAVVLDRAGITTLMWYVHILACFFGLAYLCFGKMFHIISTPLSLMLAELAPGQQSEAAAATRRTIELEGCSHGGLCHEQCPVRQRRLDRIADIAPYDPMLVYLGGRSTAELGSRPVSD